MNNTQITVQQFVADGYQELVDKKDCSVYWDQFHVERISPVGVEFFIEYGGMHQCTTEAQYIKLKVKWDSEEARLAMQLRYAEKALKEAKDALRFIKDLSQGSINSIGSTTTADHSVVKTLTMIKGAAFDNYLMLDSILK